MNWFVFVGFRYDMFSEAVTPVFEGKLRKA
jgi:hypothetical protein